MKRYRLGVLGAGNMGMAIVQGAVAAGMCKPAQALLFNRTEEKRAARQRMGFAVTGDCAKVYTDCDTVILGIKPQNFNEILPVLAQAGASPKPLVISIAAGVTFAKLQAALGADCPMVRVMPNTPLMLGEGASALVGNAAASSEQVEAVRALFASMGATVVFDREDLLNDVIPFNGSAPAYLYAFAQAMVRSATEHGIDEQDALRLFCQTMIGSAKMMLAGEKTPTQLIEAVCSPGGTTIEAMNVLRQRDLGGILDEANKKCIARAYELGK